MISISVRDLLKIEELKHFNEVQLIHPSNDALVNKYLDELAFDIDYATAYLPSKHRDLTGKIAVGYRIVGELSINRKHINSPYCGITERLVAASYTDTSLMKELAELAGKSRNFDGYAGDDMPDGDDERALFPLDQQEPDYLEVAQQIKVLENIRDGIRGPMYSASGAMKMPEEYQAWLDEQKELEGTE